MDERIAATEEEQLSICPPALATDARGDALMLAASGDWVLETAPSLETLVADVKPYAQSHAIIDLTALGRLDSVGAWLLFRLERRLAGIEFRIEWRFGNEMQERLLARIRESDAACAIEPPPEPAFLRLLEDIGVATLNILTNFGALLAFVGEVFLRLLDSLRHPSRIRLTPLVHQMDATGLRSLPIVGLISFLIGAVIVNQGAQQLRNFGAEIFAVDMVAIGMLRELGVLLTSIIIAGRSGSAFAAQIGSMVMREEVDAMRTLGIHPIDVLVLPRFVALLLVLPLLAFFADILGMIGGALMAWVELGITPEQFLNRMRDMDLLNQLYIGLIKALFFAGVIAVSGCFEGMQVRGTAESLGRNTTAAVVESIFLVIVLDAFFAVFFTTIGW
ncbi:MAG: MlaE family lipid ABC transporter permease subunit [Rhodothalassiaceae bacterium]